MWKSLIHWKHPIPNLKLLSLRWRLLHRLEGEIVRLQQKLGCYYEVVSYTKASTSSKPCCFNLNKSAEVVDIVEINCYVFVSILWGECLLGEFVYCLQNEINIRATSKGRINVKTLVFMAYLGTLSAYWLIDPCLGESQITTLNSIGRYNPGLKGKLTFSHDVHRRMRMLQYVKICLGYSKNCSPTTSLLLSLCKDSSLLCTLLNQTFCHKLEVGRLHILSLQCHLMWG